MMHKKEPRSFYPSVINIIIDFKKGLSQIVFKGNILIRFHSGKKIYKL